jgi:hypothetical protein
MNKVDVSTEAWHRVEGVTAAAEEVCSRQPLNILAASFRAGTASQARGAKSVSFAGVDVEELVINGVERKEVCPKT